MRKEAMLSAWRSPGTRKQRVLRAHWGEGLCPFNAASGASATPHTWHGMNDH